MTVKSVHLIGLALAGVLALAGCDSSSVKDGAKSVGNGTKKVVTAPGRWYSSWRSRRQIENETAPADAASEQSPAARTSGTQYQQQTPQGNSQYNSQYNAQYNRQGAQYQQPSRPAQKKNPFVEEEE